MANLRFKLERESRGSKARAATFHTLHGEVKTPVFMPVGTQATVKAQSVESLRTTGAQVILANTYHLLLRPGADVFRKFGGIHRFMNWDGPVLTDSGGFQIFSLPHARKMSEEGATFQSYVDGRTYLLSPEESIGMQRAIGSDIMMALDQCIPSTADHAQAEAAMQLTHRWAHRSLKARGDSPQALFGIVQGACFHDLRQKSAEFLTQLEFDGFAIGGLAVGEGQEQRNEFTESTAALLPRQVPRYLMGVGTPIDILEAVHRGVDLFDCILPSSLAQRGVAFTSHGKLQLRRSAYKMSDEKLDAACDCPTCRHYSRAYLHHLIKCEEVLGWQLLANHNFTYYHQMMREMRSSILEDRFPEYYSAKKPELLRTEAEDTVRTPPKKSKPKALRWATLGDYEVHRSEQGFASIKHKTSGEIMHSVSNPADEAERLYIRQSRLKQRLLETPLVIWDVGLGAASNAMAAIQCFESVGQSDALKPLKIVSFERDLDPLLLSSKHASKFPHLRHAAPYAILEKGSWSHASGSLQWDLLKGDFRDLFEAAPVPDIIFYDPFSFKTDSEMWRPELFCRIFKHLGDAPTELFTYSASTAVRAALLYAGFFVARGVATGPKTETTIAYARATNSPFLTQNLGTEWLQRWNRSQSKFPANMDEGKRLQFEERIRLHPQFRTLGSPSP